MTNLLVLGGSGRTGIHVLKAAADVDWTLARAVALTDKTAAGRVRAAEAGTDKPGTRINRADLAHFPLDTVEKNGWIRKAPLVRNTRH
ncbi:NAD(P)H-binding protein [Streptomyces bluensis]|uniref:NAD(P)H-binding protein n=1 Tax=Streptomyces bluensis TaxID=33897 RepID=UPI0033233739